MKTILLLMFLAAGTATASPGYTVSNEIRTEIAVPVDSFVKQKNGVNFIMYAFVEKLEKCHYILEGKAENKDWEIIDVKEGHQSPSGVKLAYYFKDTLDVPNQVKIYRVRKMWVEKKLVPEQLAGGGSVSARAFSADLENVNEKFAFANTANHNKVTVMFFNENGVLVQSGEFQNQSEISMSIGNLTVGKYYVVIDGDGKLYPAQMLVIDK
jgi:hypothetical protein